MKSKGVTTQMKALDEYFLMVVLTLLLNRVHVFANFMFHLNRETWQWKKLTKLVFLLQISSRTLLIHSVNCYLMYFQTNWKKQTNKQTKTKQKLCFCWRLMVLSHECIGNTKLLAAKCLDCISGLWLLGFNCAIQGKLHLDCECERVLGKKWLKLWLVYLKHMQYYAIILHSKTIGKVKLLFCIKLKFLLSICGH